MKIARPPGGRSWPRANPASVLISSEIGTTPMTMRVLDHMSAAMSAALNAAAKLPQCGAGGPRQP